MKRDVLLSMSANELETYAKIIGIDISKAKTIKTKVDLIEKRRSRKATIKLLGKEFSVSIKRAHDMRLAEKYSNIEAFSNEDVTTCFIDFLGEKQEKKLRDLCTDEDGTVDSDAYACAFSQLVDLLVSSGELKNF